MMEPNSFPSMDLENKFNEKSHAFIAAKYYEYLVKGFGEPGRKAFIHGTQYYALQRGRRMAQRAIRDGKELTYESYLRYGEWESTEEAKKEGIANAKEIVSDQGDYIFIMNKCPWRAQFEEMGATKAGIEYCTHLDNSIARGFNPYMVYEVDLSHMAGKEVGGYCIHTIKDAAFKNANILDKAENKKSFEFHCAHSYWSFREIAIAIFGIEGEKVASEVLESFSKEYGKDAIDDIYKYRDINFNKL